MQEMIETQQELNKDIRDTQIEQTTAMRDLFEYIPGNKIMTIFS